MYSVTFFPVVQSVRRRAFGVTERDTHAMATYKDGYVETAATASLNPVTLPPNHFISPQVKVLLAK
jgi:hypothetical protein